MPDVTPVVFVHGIRLSGVCWNQQRPLLPGRVVSAPDLPGHGRRRGETFTIADAVTAVTEAIDDVGGRAVLVGHSLGGFVAIATAAANPNRVARLVGIGCSLRPGRSLRTGFVLAQRTQVSARRAQAAACGFGTPRPSGWALGRALLPASIAEPIIAAGIATEVIPDVVAAARAADPLTELATYRGPVLLLNGRRDHFRLGERRFLEVCRNGTLQVVPGAGHYLPLTHGPQVAATIEQQAQLADIAGA